MNSRQQFVCRAVSARLDDHDRIICRAVFNSKPGEPYGYFELPCDAGDFRLGQDYWFDLTCLGSVA